MKTRPETLAAYIEYVAVIPVLLVLEAATDQSGWTDEDHEIVGEQIAEIANERALAGCGSTASSDARRIWAFQARQRALRSYAFAAPSHAEVCEAIAASLDI